MKKSLDTVSRVVVLLAFWLVASLAQAVDVVTYIHTDVAGTPLLATDAAGGVVWKESYQPFGGRLNHPPAGDNDQWFAGKPYDSDTGLSYFGARYYDPLLGRFMGMDPAPVDPGNIHGLNRYNYGNNNPYRYVDPDGRQSVELSDEGRELIAARSPLAGATAGFGNAMAGPVSDAVEGLFKEAAIFKGLGVAFGLGVKAAEVGAAARGLGNQNPLYKAAVQQFKDTDLSSAGRALTKHPELIGQTKDTLRQTLRTDGAINDAAHGVLRDIMRNGVTTTPTLGRYGTVTQIQVPGGFGARWSSDGSFIGFINP